MAANVRGCSLHGMQEVGGRFAARKAINGSEAAGSTGVLGSGDTKTDRGGKLVRAFSAGSSPPPPRAATTPRAQASTVAGKGRGYGSRTGFEVLNLVDDGEPAGVNRSAVRSKRRGTRTAIDLGHAADVVPLVSWSK